MASAVMNTAMNQLPIIPTAGTPICIDDVVRIEATIAQQVVVMNDVTALDELRTKADALARYLQGKELHGPMLGAQRRIEARIGQLLGEARNGRPSENLPRAEGLSTVSQADRNRFRLLARGFDVLKDDEWRQSRRALITLLQQKLPTTPHDNNGSTAPDKHAAAPSPVEPGAATDPEMPTAEEMAEMDAAIEREYSASIAKVMGENDRLAAAHEEIKRQAAEIAVLKTSRDGYMNGQGEVIRRYKGAQRQIERLERKRADLERESEQLKADNEALRERIAMMEEPA